MNVRARIISITNDSQCDKQYKINNVIHCVISILQREFVVDVLFVLFMQGVNCISQHNLSAHFIFHYNVKNLIEIIVTKMLKNTNLQNLKVSHTVYFTIRQFSTLVQDSTLAPAVYADSLGVARTMLTNA
jgi:hypothetical protein